MSTEQILLRMQQGTTKDEHLCGSCVNAFVRRGAGGSGDLQICFPLSQSTQGRQGVIREKIAQCSSYYPKALPQLYQLENIAWEIVSKGNKKGIGFISPDDRRQAGIASQPAPPQGRPV